MAATTTARSKKGQERREAILNTACKLFAQRGYDAVTFKELAAEMGCSEGLFFRYFASKEEIYDTLFQEFREITIAPFVLPRQEGETGRRWLDRFWVTMPTYKPSMQREGLQAAVFSRLQKSDQIRKLYTETSDIVEDLLIPIFRQGKEDGSLPATDPARAAYLFWLIVYGLAEHRREYPGRYNPAISFEEILRAALSV